MYQRPGHGFEYQKVFLQLNDLKEESQPKIFLDE